MTEIFVFGSNLAGRHGRGAALYAKRRHGAIQGQGSGLQGNSWGIPTKDETLKVLSLGKINFFVGTFLAYARNHRELTFRLTPIGCGLAGYSPEQIAPLFREAPSNVLLPPEFLRIIRPQDRASRKDVLSGIRKDGIQR